MNIILEATGQVGSAIVNHLTKKGLPVKAVIRNQEKADSIRATGANVAIADYYVETLTANRQFKSYHHHPADGRRCFSFRRHSEIFVSCNAWFREE